MKKIMLLLLLLVFLFPSLTFSQTEPLVSCSYKVVVCKEDVCHLKVSLFINNVNPFPVVIRVLYLFQNKDGKVLFSFWTSPLSIVSHGSYSVQEDVLVDRARLEQVDKTLVHVVPCSRKGPGKPFRYF